MDNKEKLDLEKNQLKDIEQQQIAIWARIREQERKRFNECDLISLVAKGKNDDDLQVLMEKFTEWIGFVKDNTKKNIYLELLKSVYRIHSYCFYLETASSQAIVQAKTEEEIRINSARSFSTEKLLLIQKNKNQEQKIKQLEEEIKFLTKNG